MSAREKKLLEILKELERNSDIDGSAVVSLKGQMMAAALHEDVDSKAVGAMSAALSSVGLRVSGTLGAGELSQIVLTGENKTVIVNEMANAVLIALAPADAKIGLLDFEISQAIEQIILTMG